VYKKEANQVQQPISEHGFGDVEIDHLESYCGRQAHEKLLALGLPDICEKGHEEEMPKKDDPISLLSPSVSCSTYLQSSLGASSCVSSCMSPSTSSTASRVPVPDLRRTALTRCESFGGGVNASTTREPEADFEEFICVDEVQFTVSSRGQQRTSRLGRGVTLKDTMCMDSTESEPPTDGAAAREEAWKAAYSLCSEFNQTAEEGEELSICSRRKHVAAVASFSAGEDSEAALQRFRRGGSEVKKEPKCLVFFSEHPVPVEERVELCVSGPTKGAPLTIHVMPGLADYESESAEEGNGSFNTMYDVSYSTQDGPNVTVSSTLHNAVRFEDLDDDDDCDEEGAALAVTSGILAGFFGLAPTEACVFNEKAPQWRDSEDMCRRALRRQSRAAAAVAAEEEAFAAAEAVYDCFSLLPPRIPEEEEDGIAQFARSVGYETDVAQMIASEARRSLHRDVLYTAPPSEFLFWSREGDETRSEGSEMIYI